MHGVILTADSMRNSHFRLTSGQNIFLKHIPWNLECGVRCELSNDHCDFFTVTSGIIVWYKSTQVVYLERIGT